LDWISTQTGELGFLQNDPVDMKNGLLSPDGSHMAFTVNRDGYEDLMLWGTKSHQPIRLPALPRGISFPSSFSSDNRRLFITFNASSIIDDIWIIDIPAVQAQQITFSSYGGVDQSLLVDPSLIHYQAFDGLEIPAFLYLPKNTPKDKSLPVILSVHGGPEEQEQPYFYPYYQYLINRGYAILTPNTRGSRGYGKRYLALDNGTKRWDALKDLLAAADWIASHPSLNSNKIAIMGFSYGGFAVLAMLAHYPDRFVAGIDIYGPADLKTFLANTSIHRRPNRIAEYGDPVLDSAFMDAISPAGHAENIKAPLLVIQGANDPIVPPSESEQIVENIEAAGGVAEYMLLSDEGHGLSNLENRIKVFKAVVDFLDQHVQNNSQGKP
jgi:dipeptidyl aminopeptidase/acylaminoacyl peptidase